MGKRSLEDAGYTLCADTIFSAMCHEFVKQGETCLRAFVGKVCRGQIQISDAFPYIGDTYYIPKPMIKVTAEREQGDSVIKKAYKKLAYIPAQSLDIYLEGRLPVQREEEYFRKNLGDKATRTKAFVRSEEQTRPYRVGTYYFKQGSGLYVILGYEKEEDLREAEDCLDALALSGVGGKRSAGLGRYVLKAGVMPENLKRRLSCDRASVSMTLSVSLPRDEELESALERANFLLLKRSGFVLSPTYAREQQRKRDLYVMQSGSCFGHRFEGDVYDVSAGGAHPVYRYAKPLFMEVIS